jgi:uncharacterized phiE125 gp8 family phage protein
VRSALKVVTPSDAELVTLQELKDHLRVTISGEDGYLDGLRAAAWRAAEQYCSSYFLDTVVQIAIDGSPGVRRDADRDDRWSARPYGGPRQWRPEGEGDYLELSVGPILSSQPIAVTWYASDQSTTAWTKDTEYWLDDLSPLPRLVLKDGQSWPTDIRRQNSVIVQCHVGYGEDASAVPEDIKLAIKRIAATVYEHRDDQIESTRTIDMKIPVDAEKLLAPYRLRWVA